MNERIIALTDWLDENNIDAAMVTAPENVFYFTGFHSNPHERVLALMVFPHAEPFLFCPQLDAEDARNAGWNAEIIGYTDVQDPWTLIKAAVSRRSVTVNKLAIEKEHMNVERYEKVNDIFQDPTFVAAEQKLRQMRMLKSEDEIAKLREACRLADLAIEAGVSEIREGKTELEILAAIEYEMKKSGINQMSFSTMVLTGKNGASPHGTPGQTRIQKGDLVLFDLGVVYQGYCSDITRTVAFGDINDKQKEIYETVLNAQLAAVEASKPGALCSELDLIARNVITERGYGDYFPHRLGHGLGISIHEYPSLTENTALALQPGMVYTIEPGIYMPDVAGVRIEDDVLITQHGYELLTKYPKTLQIIK
ncbi:M24 family metallopeptidase [Peribacillus sp. SCS-155]|uniref:M24 family metallopeptidase n=1 Tax=Peribacillus sedimenti TaxID=3115297 RepID=UPI0039063FB8